MISPPTFCARASATADLPTAVGPAAHRATGVVVHGGAGEVCGADFGAGGSLVAHRYLKLLGFGIWQQRNGSGHNVTFPARHFTVNGERRNFTLLRAVDDRSAEDRIRQLVLRAYAAESGQSDT